MLQTPQNNTLLTCSIMHVKEGLVVAYEPGRMFIMNIHEYSTYLLMLRACVLSTADQEGHAAHGGEDVQQVGRTC